MTQGSEYNDDTQAFSVLSPGTAVSHYTIVEKIGEGGMGEVYLADDSRLRRQVALKFLSAKYTSDDEFKQRFMREAHTAAAVNHPNIVTIHDIETYRGRPFIVMEYVGGRSLKTILRDSELSPGEIVGTALQIAKGIERAHDAGIVHRDLKSDNILLTVDGRAKILDFGLAKAEHDENLTQTGTALGTVAYMSPEQVRGDTVDQRSDLFSFGVVLYEMITRRLPFAGDNMAVVINAILNADPEPLSDQRVGHAVGLREIVEKLLAKRAADRYANTSELVADLERVKQGIAPIALGTKRIRFSLTTIIVSIGLLAAVIGLVMIVLPYLQSDDSRSEDTVVLAVLPFENVGSPDHDYFASGITDEITTQLTKLRGIRVVSRSSSSQYKGSAKTHRQIGEELGVNCLLEGSVQWDVTDTASRVRINTSLTDVRDGTSLWAESYHRVMDDIFAVQSDISRKVMTALNVALMETDEQLLDQQPTENLDAYNLYLQGLTYFNNRDWNLAQSMFHDAITLDRTFAEAWAALSRIESLIYWWYIDRSEERIHNAKEAAETALHLDSTLAEAHLAMGRYFYRGYLDYDHALKWYRKALAIQPNNSDIQFAIGSVERRQGRWDQAVRYYADAIALDPRSRTKVTNLARTQFLMRDFDAALESVNRLVGLSPDYAYAHDLRARIFAFGMNSLDQAKVALNNALTIVRPDELVDVLIALDLAGGKPDDALNHLRSARDGGYFAQDSGFYYLQLGEVFYDLGQPALSRAHYDSARVILEDAIKQAPEEPQYHSMLGVAYAGLGDSTAAVSHGKQASELCSITDDALSGIMWLHNLAIIYAMVKDYNSAIDELRFLLSVPSDVTRPYLMTYPAFKELHNIPEFHALLQIE